MNKYILGLSAAVLIGGNAALLHFNKPAEPVKTEQVSKSKIPLPKPKPKSKLAQKKKPVKNTPKSTQEQRDTFWFSPNKGL